MSEWRTLSDGRKILLKHACLDRNISSISKEFRNPESLVRIGSNRSKQGRLIPALCFWCKAPVYFVENGSNGGCFLADRLPSEGGWSVHSCWLINKGHDQQSAIKYYRRKAQEHKQNLKNSSKNKQSYPKKNTLKTDIRRLHLHDWLKNSTKTYIVRLDRVEANKQILVNDQNYQIVQFRDKEQVIRALILSSQFPNGLLGNKCFMITLTIRRFHKERIPFISAVFSKEKCEIFNPKQISRMEINDVVCK
ncbi:hypothetical protein [Vibrio coralliilyticus]|uniref:hypothetical protein n=1 Tax=Vibrio coralliilyticus TaxID=190893 RepID=UPI0002FF8D34|nr:hypothetical protein [Vibrio coralliilyticus]